VAANVLQHGTGALNIDGCRFAYGDPAWPGPQEAWTFTQGPKTGRDWGEYGGGGEATARAGLDTGHNLGRWPANLYACPKPSRAEREAGCERLPGRTGAEATDRTEGTAGLDSPRAGAGRTAGRVYGMKRCEICGRQAVNVSGTCQCPEPRWVDVGRTQGGVKNHHPTVKPIGVMRWLVKLVGGQRGSVILDPFMGSGTTGCAAMLEGFDFIGIEREPEYMQIAEARIRHHLGALFAHRVQVIETEEGSA